MKKHLFRKLLLIIAVSITLFSCMHDEMISSADQPTSRDYASKSPWKEDQVYIKKVQQVFLQNANVTYFEKKYGKVHWDYAMSLGTFDESYLVVPILKDNHVVTAMKVYRIDDKVYFREKNDPEFIDFFNDVMFKNIIDTEEKILYNDTSAESKTLIFKCTYRTISIGCPEGYNDCGYVPGRTISECKWTESGDNGIPPMQLCDPMECGGGGGGGAGPDPGFNYPEPPKDPCEKISTIGKNEKTKNLFKNLKGKTSSNVEHGYILNKTGNTINETSVQGVPGDPEIKINVSNQFDGIIHSHYQGLLSVFSVYDMFVLAKAYKSGLIKDMNSFVMGVVTASGTQYMMVIDDPVKFASFADNLFTGNDFDDVVVKNYETTYKYIFKITSTNSIAANEKSFYNYLKANGTGLKILKGDANFNNWGVLTKDSNGNVTSQDCQ